jgi:hypothetical protein
MRGPVPHASASACQDVFVMRSPLLEFRIILNVVCGEG